MKDILRLSIWNTLSPTVAILIVMIGIDTIRRRSATGILWLAMGGILALVGTVALRSAQGLKPREVRSGELRKRAFMLAKGMEVDLKRVAVVPFGRGHLTNAFAGVSSVAVTDDYGHWLHGAELDFIIAHELAHIQRKHTRIKILLMVGMFATLSVFGFALPKMPLLFEVFFRIGVVVVPLLAFYFVSRQFEYASDRTAVMHTGDSDAATRALIGLYRRSGVPVEQTAVEALFSTHPTLKARLDAINRIAKLSVANQG